MTRRKLIITLAATTALSALALGNARAHDLPKVANLKRLFAESYRAEPVLVSKTGLSN